MAQESEPLFAGGPEIPPPEVFEQARRRNPVWYQVLEQAYAQFAARPESQGVYADPKGSGATVQQMWLVYTLFGIFPYCVLARPLPAKATERIDRLVRSSPSELIDSLVTLQRVQGSIGAHVAFHDGAMGHAITVMSYDADRDRFIYHDPWPERSLLAKENNAAGVDAQPEGTRWSVTREELTRVIFLAFIFPHQWAKIQGQAFDLTYDELRRSQFFTFFHVNQLDERTDDGQTTRLLAPGRFQDSIKLVVENVEETDKVTGAGLQVRSDWLVPNFMMAIDLAKSFIGAFAPVPDRDRLGEIAKGLWDLRQPDALARARAANAADESEAMGVIHAFMGASKGATVTTDFATLTVGVMPLGGARWHSIEYKLI